MITTLGIGNVESMDCELKNNTRSMEDYETKKKFNWEMYAHVGRKEEQNKSKNSMQERRYHRNAT